MANEIEHLFMCLLVFYMSFVKCMFKSFVHFKNWVVLLSCKISLCILETSLCEIQISDIFSHSVACISVFLTVSFKELKFTFMVKFSLLILSFMFLVPQLRNLFIPQYHKDFLLCFILEVLQSQLLCLYKFIFRSMIHFKLMFVSGVR